MERGFVFPGKLKCFFCGRGFGGIFDAGFLRFLHPPLQAIACGHHGVIGFVEVPISDKHIPQEEDLVHIIMELFCLLAGFYFYNRAILELYNRALN